MADELHTLLCNHIVQPYATYTCRGAYRSNLIGCYYICSIPGFSWKVDTDSCHLMRYINNSPQCHYETRNKEIKGRTECDQNPFHTDLD